MGPLAEWCNVMQEAIGAGVEENEVGISTPPAFTRLDWACLGCLTVLGLLLRVWGIQNESAWYDEVVSLRNLHEPNLLAFLRSLRLIDPPMMPLYFSLEYFVGRLSGESLVAIRLLSVLFSVLSIPLMGLLGLRVFGRRAGLFAALYLALSLSHIYYAQEVRMYALFVLLSLSSACLLAALLETWRLRGWVLLALVNTLLLWCHIYAIWLILGETVFLFLTARPYRRTLVPWLALHGLLLIPWLCYVQTIDFAQLNAAASWILAPDLKGLYNIYLFLIGAQIATPLFPLFYPPSPVFDFFLWWRHDLAGGLYAIVIAYGVWTLLSHGSGASSPTPGAMPPRRAVLFALTLGVLPIALLAVISLFHPCLIHRYVLNSSIELYLLCGAGTALIPRRGVRIAVVLALVACCAVSFAGAPRPARGDWRELGERIQREGRADDVIAVIGWINFIVMEYNAPPLKDRMVLLNGSEDFARIEEESRLACRDLWIGLVDVAHSASEKALDVFRVRCAAQVSQVKSDPVSSWFFHVRQSCH